MSDTLTRVEDALAVAMVAIFGGSLGATIYKAGDGAAIAFPAIIVSADRETVPHDASTSAAITTEVDCSVTVETQSDDTTRAAHGTLSASVEDVVKRSIDQIVTECNAAAIAGITFQVAQFTGSERSYDDHRRKTTYTLNMTVHAV